MAFSLSYFMCLRIGFFRKVPERHSDSVLFGYSSFLSETHVVVRYFGKILIRFFSTDMYTSQNEVYQQKRTVYQNFVMAGTKLSKHLSTCCCFQKLVINLALTFGQTNVLGRRLDKLHVYTYIIHVRNLRQKRLPLLVERNASCTCLTLAWRALGSKRAQLSF